MLKRCSKCKRELPIDGNFARNRAMKDGLSLWCSDCRKEYYQANRDKITENKREYYQANRETILANKRVYFQTHKKQRRDYQRQHRNLNRDSIRAYHRAWMEANRERYREWQRDYYAKNREDRREYLNTWRYQNIDKEREYARRWRTHRPDQWKAMRLRRRAVRVGLPGTITAEDWRYCLDYWQHRCAVCGRPRGLWHILAADHWIPVKSPDCPGSIPTNIVPLCHGRGGCNGAKGDKDPAAWLVSVLGKRNGKRKLAEIAAYFAHLRNLPKDETQVPAVNIALHSLDMPPLSIVNPEVERPVVSP